MSGASFTLASASPRRRELLGRVGLHPAVAPVDLDESFEEGESPRSAVERLARSKARASSADPVLAADTVVALAERPLGKPRDRAHAEELLRSLSGRTHQVHSAVVVRSDGREHLEVVTTDVRFRSLLALEIDAYLATDEPWDKAGAYAIQGLGGAFVDRLDGSYTNVVGLPLAETLDLLRRAGLWRSNDHA